MKNIIENISLSTSGTGMYEITNKVYISKSCNYEEIYKKIED